MATKEIFLTDDDIETINNLIDERRDAIEAHKTMPVLSKASALRELDNLVKALGTAELF